MPTLTEQQHNDVTARNEQICERFTTLRDRQPLATPNKIIHYLAGEYNLTPQYVGIILRDNGIDTNSKTA